MRKTSVFIWLAVLMASLSNLSAQVFQPADGRKVEESKDYFLGELSGFQVAPSGKGVAYLKYEANRWVLYWDNINGGRETRVSKPEQANVVDFRWVGDDAIVYSLGTGAVGSELHRYEIFTKAYNQLTTTPGLIKFLDSHYYNSGTSILIRGEAEASETKVYSILPGMRELKYISSGTGVNWVEGFASGGMFCVEKSEEGTRFVNRSVDGGEKLASMTGLCDIRGLALAGKSKDEIYAISDRNRNTVALVKLNMRDGAEKEVVFERAGCSISKVLFSSTKSMPLVVWYKGIEEGYEVVSEDFKSTLSLILQKLPTQNGFDLIHTDLAENVWIGSVVNQQGARVYFHYNVANREFKQFGNQPMAAEWVSPTLEFIPTANQDKLLVRFYSPSEVNSKTTGVLVFRNAPWKATSVGAMDVLIQQLVQQGFVVADVDLAYSEVSQKKLVHSGYDQLIDRMVDEIPVIQKLMRSNFELQTELLAVVGEGIGSRAALRVTAKHTASVLRCALINPAPELAAYMSQQLPVELNTKSLIHGFGDGTMAMSLSYIAREPLFVYSAANGPYYTSCIEPAIRKFSQEGRSPESYMVGAGLGDHFSAGVIRVLSDKVSSYLRK